jgi:hypothetical protein
MLFLLDICDENLVRRIVQFLPLADRANAGCVSRTFLFCEQRSPVFLTATRCPYFVDGDKPREPEVDEKFASLAARYAGRIGGICFPVHGREIASAAARIEHMFACYQPKS